MKKTLLTLALAVTAFSAKSQVIFSVLSPASIQGNYDFTNNGTGSSWGLPNLLDPADAIQSTLVLVDDGTAADSLGCNNLINGAALAGKIAVVYRRDCSFGLKAQKAQAAGAIGVVIINHEDGLVTMTGGTEGLTVNIPVTFITRADGAILRGAMAQGDVEVFIGNKLYFFENDLGLMKDRLLIAPAAARPSALTQNASEYSVKQGAWVYNFGQNDITGSTLKAEVTFNNTSVSSMESDPFDIESGDSLYVEFDNFSQASYPAGKYKLTYSIVTAEEDYEDDNTFSSDFTINDKIFSLARLDENNLPINTGGTRFAENVTNTYFSCIVFRDANANRLGAEGLYFAASVDTTGGTNSMDGQEVIVTVNKWNNAFTDMDDAGFNFTQLEELTSGVFYYNSNDQMNQMMYQAFDQPFVLENNQRYLFCTQTSDPLVYFGFDNVIDYSYVSDTERQPLHPLHGPNTAGTNAWFSLGFGRTPAIGLKTFPAAELGILETNTVAASVYPNPAKDVVTIAFNGFNGDAQLTVTDLAGKTVINKNVTVTADGQLKVNVPELNNGMYIFNMQLGDGTVSKFNVVINK